ncbi:MAG: T9SS type A sorting domain-containing protein [Bacteroidia bacterium]
MNKNLLFLFVVIASAFINPAEAQPTITASSFTPQPGENFLVHLFPYQAAGIGGAGLTWDFSGITATGTANMNHVDPASTPSSASFPDATVSISQGGAYSYFEGTSSAWYYNGVVASGNLIPYSNAEKLMEFPFTYNDSYTDNFGATYTAGVTITRAGTVNVSADAYGTLILPYGTINNVIRVKVIENYTDSYTVTVPVTLNYAATNYYWYKADTHYPVLSISSLDQDGTLYQGASYLDQAHISAVEESIANAIGLNVFPNPSGSFSTISFDLVQPEKVILSIYNSLGELVEVLEQNQLGAGNHRYELNTTDYAAGLYTLKVAVGDKAGMKKISVL